MRIRVGTRGSVLALKQAEAAQQAIKQKAWLETEIITIKTSGDKIQNRSLAEIGGKGLFIKEIELALLNNEIDIAVHSLKDVPGNFDEGLTIAGLLEREDPRDVFISRYHKNLESLPYNAVIGTCAPRREAQLRLDLQTKMLRGNIATRIEKAKNFDGIILALAGLKRANMLEHITEIIPIDIMLPAVGQGVICLQCRKNDKEIINILDSVIHQETKITTLAERNFLITIKGDCHTPLAAFAKITSNKLHLKAMLKTSSGVHFTERTGSTQDAVEIGKDAAKELLAR